MGSYCQLQCPPWCSHRWLAEDACLSSKVPVFVGVLVRRALVPKSGSVQSIAQSGTFTYRISHIARRMFVLVSRVPRRLTSLIAQLPAPRGWNVQLLLTGGGHAQPSRLLDMIQLCGTRGWDASSTSGQYRHYKGLFPAPPFRVLIESLDNTLDIYRLRDYALLSSAPKQYESRRVTNRSTGSRVRSVFTDVREVQQCSIAFWIAPFGNPTTTSSYLRLFALTSPVPASPLNLSNPGLGLFRSMKCAECLRHQRSYNGTFSLEEFRKVGEQKKCLQEKSRAKRREIARLRRLLAKAEEEDSSLQDSVAELDERSNRMLKREIQALGVFEQVGHNQSIALGNENFVFSSVPATNSINWSVLRFVFLGFFIDLHGS
ncbi:hypothetical protein KCU88_g196, partial [Aureobasidium melanogenum]